MLIVILFLNYQFAECQNLIATYTETRKIERKLPDNPDPKIQELIKNAGIQNKELLCVAGTSLYREKQVEMEDGPDHQVVIRIGDDDRGSVYKDLKKNQLLRQNEFFGRFFLIRTALNPITWEPQSEEKSIGSYKCMKATATIDTMKITAWYCPDIPINDGPDIFWGLPGLILEVDIDNGKKVITLNSVKITAEPLAFDIPDKGKEVTQPEFNAIKKEKLDEIRKNTVPGAPHRVEIRVVN